MRKKLLLIDGDQLVYQITAACETEMPAKDVLKSDVAWMYDGWVVLGCDYPSCLRTVTNTIRSLVKGYDMYCLIFSTRFEKNYRYTVLPSYKGGRVSRKPLAYYAIVDHLLFNHPSKCIEGVEGDDTLSIVATQHMDKDVTIWSQDKDMRQVPGVYLNNTTGTTTYTSPQDANHFRWLQCLIGDNTDGYKGCPGYGPVKAERKLSKLLGSPELEYMKVVIDTYLENSMSVADAVAQINCARILRHTEYNFETNKPILIEVNHV